MSTTDRWEVEYTCPCGKGTALKECSQPDHCWAPPVSTSWTMQCPDCAREWAFHGRDGTVVRADELRKHHALEQVERDLSKRIWDIRRAGAAALAARLEPTPPKTKKAEMALLAAKYRAYGSSYATYLRERQSKSFHDMLAYTLYSHPEVLALVPQDLDLAHRVSRADLAGHMLMRVTLPEKP